MNSREGHLPKKDVRSRTEISVPVAKSNRVREGKLKSRRFVCTQANERLVSLRSCPPKMVLGSFTSLSDVGIVHGEIEVFQLWR
jgi:hypothetical protein